MGNPGQGESSNISLTFGENALGLWLFYDTLLIAEVSDELW
jgi:hypothetical protein